MFCNTETCRSTKSWECIWRRSTALGSETLDGAYIKKKKKRSASRPSAHSCRTSTHEVHHKQYINYSSTKSPLQEQDYDHGIYEHAPMPMKPHRHKISLSPLDTKLWIFAFPLWHMATRISQDPLITRWISWASDMVRLLCYSDDWKAYTYARELRSWESLCARRVPGAIT